MEKDKLISQGLNENDADFISHAAQSAINTIAMQGIMPMTAFIRHKKEGEEAVGVMVMDSVPPHMKDLIVEIIRCKAHDLQADAVVMTSEMWVMPADVTPEQAQELYKHYGSIAQIPGRREGVFVALNTHDKKAMVTYIMTRDENGSINGINIDEVNVETDDERIGGRMAETLYRPEDIENPNFPKRYEMTRLVLSMLEQEIDLSKGGGMPSIN